MAAVIAIVGRPNVGKSTLFNRLTGTRAALVDPAPGVTRDRRTGAGRLADLSFVVVDTAGFEDGPPETLEGRMRAQTERAVADADAVLMVYDARAGVMPLDEHFAGWLRRTGARVILVANKCEGRAAEPGLVEGYSLGLGEPVPVSAEHNEGMVDLYNVLRPIVEGRDETKVTSEPAAPVEPAEPPETSVRADAAAAESAAEPSEEVEEDAGDDAGEEALDIDDADDAEVGPLRLAVIGRPNVGKSTLINRLLGEERVITGPEPGMTRDAIEIGWRWRDQPVLLFDTAGMRRRSRVAERLERMSVADTLRAIQFAHAVVLVIDAGMPLERQDLTLARLIVDEGRAPIIAVNKWDAVNDRQALRRQIEDRLEQSLPMVRGVRVVPLSALTGEGVARLMPQVAAAVETWRRRLPTGPLNRWFAATVEAHPPPVVSGRRARLRYITQVKARPPTFAIFTTRPEAVSESYLRYLANTMREAFDLQGIPLRLLLRRRRNPYVDDDRG